jgi:hypothetical protein
VFHGNSLEQPIAPLAPARAAPGRPKAKAGLEVDAVAGLKPKAQPVSNACGGGLAREYGDRSRQS